jgi:hypothetical protein
MCECTCARASTCVVRIWCSADFHLTDSIHRFCRRDRPPYFCEAAFSDSQSRANMSATSDKMLEHRTHVVDEIVSTEISFVSDLHVSVRIVAMSAYMCALEVLEAA